MNGECRRVRPLLDSCLSDELPPGQRTSVEGHVAACPACGTELERRRQVRRELAAIVDAGDASALERRILAAVEREHRGRSRRLVWSAAVAASLVATVVGVRLLSPPVSRVDQAASEGARNAHRVCALQGHYPVPLPPDQAATRLDGYAGLRAVIEPELSRGATLLEAHVCEWPRRYGHVILQRGGHRVSVLATARDPASTGRASGRIEEREDAGLRLAEAGSDAYAAFVVSDLQAAELRPMSGRVLPAALEALGAGGR